MHTYLYNCVVDIMCWIAVIELRRQLVLLLCLFLSLSYTFVRGLGGRLEALLCRKNLYSYRHWLRIIIIISASYVNIYIWGSNYLRNYNRICILSSHVNSILYYDFVSSYYIVQKMVCKKPNWRVLLHLLLSFFFKTQLFTVRSCVGILFGWWLASSSLLGRRSKHFRF